MSMKRVYMDWSASTPLHPRVRRAMRRAEARYGNPSAPHEEGRKARALVEGARTQIARTLSVKADELTFTSGGTESNNLALRWVREGHIILSVFEHPSIREAAEELSSGGVSISYVSPTPKGIITPEAVVALIRPETALVSVALVQGEIGTIQPIKDIARMTKKVNPKLFVHTDASQAPLWMDAAPHALGADLVTYDAHKIQGPKGIGLLYRKFLVPLTPVVRGGGQERGVRPGTEDTAAIVGMAEAFMLASEGRSERAQRVAAVRDYVVALLKIEIPSAEVNGGMQHRVANNIHLSIGGTDGDYLAVLLDTHGIAVSPRSACVAAGTLSSAVLALGKDEEAARGTLRFTLGPDATRADARRAVRALKAALRVVL